PSRHGMAAPGCSTAGGRPVFESRLCLRGWNMKKWGDLRPGPALWLVTDRGTQREKTMLNGTTSSWLLLFLIATSPAGAATLQGPARATRPGTCPSPRDSVDYPGLATALDCTQPGGAVQLGGGTWTGPGNRGLVVERSVRIVGAGRLKTIIDAEQADRL